MTTTTTKIDKRTLVPVGIIGTALLLAISAVVFITSVQASTRENKILIENNHERLDRYEKRFDRLDNKLDEVLREVKR